MAAIPRYSVPTTTRMIAMMSTVTVSFSDARRISTYCANDSIESVSHAVC